MVQVNRDAVEVVHPERADEARGIGRPRRVLPRRLRVEHRVIDDELATSLEDLAERLPTVPAIEDVLLVDQLPGQAAPLAAEPIAEACELLLLGQMLLPGRHPFLVPDDRVGRHLILLPSPRSGLAPTHPVPEDYRRDPGSFEPWCSPTSWARPSSSPASAIAWRYPPRRPSDPRAVSRARRAR